MGKPKRPEYGNLVMFVFSENIEKKLQILIPMLEKEFGPIDYVSKVLDFSKYTNFYSKEIGEELHGKFLSFKELIYPTEIVNIKLKTNAIEKRFAINGKRKIMYSDIIRYIVKENYRGPNYDAIIVWCNSKIKKGILFFEK